MAISGRPGADAETALAIRRGARPATAARQDDARTCNRLLLWVDNRAREALRGGLRRADEKKECDTRRKKGRVPRQGTQTPPAKMPMLQRLLQVHWELLVQDVGSCVHVRFDDPPLDVPCCSAWYS
jgi:hypothetical protein